MKDYKYKNPLKGYYQMGVYINEVYFTLEQIHAIQEYIKLQIKDPEQFEIVRDYLLNKLKTT